MIFLNQTGDKENIPNLQADIGGGELIRTLQNLGVLKAAHAILLS